MIDCEPGFRNPTVHSLDQRRPINAGAGSSGEAPFEHAKPVGAVDPTV